MSYIQATAGVISTAIGSSDDYGQSISIQSDGKILVAGYSWNGNNFDYSLVRYNSSGSLDTSFSGDGKLTTGIGAGDDEAYSVQPQADGKILVAGSSYNGSNKDFSLVRYSSAGLLDAVFSGDGKVTTAFGSSEDEGKDVSLKIDGKILVAGYSWNGTNNYDFALSRYNQDGSLDSSFAGAGKVTTGIGSSADYGYSIATQTDGKILLAGYSWNGSNNDFALVRYNSNGTLDTSFAGDGKVTTAIGTGDDKAYSVMVQTDGKIVIAGSSYNGSNNDFALVRYNSNGTLDTTFSTDGKLTTAIGTAYDEGQSVTLQTDGKILLAGYSWNGSNYDFALIRYNRDGSLDNTFDGDGKVTTAVGSKSDYAYSVAVQADGKILVAGNSDNGSNKDFAVVRYNSNGSLDSTFNGVTGINHIPTGSVSINDSTPTQGQTLTASNTLADADGLGTITYEWQAAGITVGSGKKYTLTKADIGKKISVSASYTDLGGTFESEISSVSTKVRAWISGTSGNDRLIGGTDNDFLVGKAGADTLNGGAGADTIEGGNGKDMFKFTGLSKDTLKDFVVADDTIQLENSVFKKLPAGELKAANFEIGTEAGDSNDYIVYNHTQGALYYDADGSGSTDAVQIAIVGTSIHPSLTVADFIVL